MSEEFIDAAALTGRYVLALVFIAAALPKVAARRDFERAVFNYDLLPASLVPVVAQWLPRLELACALALLGGVATPVFAGIAALLLALFALAVAVNLVRGRRIDCGCEGSIVPRRIGWGLVSGDLLLAAMAGLVAIRDPGLLSVLTFTEPTTTLTAADGIAMLALAAALVLGRLILASARQVWRAERDLQSLLESGR